MVLVFAIAIGIVVGLALGGPVGRLADLQLRGMPLFGVAIALQVLAFPSGELPVAGPGQRRDGAVARHVRRC